MSERKIKGIREILTIPGGLKAGEITMNYTDTPADPTMQPAINKAKARTQKIRVTDVLARGGTPDHNGPKVWLKKVNYDGKRLALTTGQTDYFTLWGLPGAAPELHQQFLTELPNAGETKVPNGIATHNTIVTSDELLVTLRSGAVGFSAGRASATFEEQMELDDETPIHAFIRGLHEEFGVSENIDKIKLLGLGAEENTAYTAVCQFGETQLRAGEIAQLWHDAPEQHEGTTILAVPTNKIDVFTLDEIPRDFLEPYVVAGELPDKANFIPHPVVPWRMKLLKEHLAQL